MGFDQRDYARREEPGMHLGSIETITTKIVLVNFGVFVIQLLTDAGPSRGWFNNDLSLHASVWVEPWRCFELLTYGFLHSVDDFRHIIFNMLVLWFLGREVEARYGRREFLVMYLASIVVAGVVWSLAESFAGNPNASCWGASGGVSAVLVLFALNFPHRKLLLFFAIPIEIMFYLVSSFGYYFHLAIHPNCIGA